MFQHEPLWAYIPRYGNLKFAQSGHDACSPPYALCSQDLFESHPYRPPMASCCGSDKLRDAEAFVQHTLRQAQAGQIGPRQLGNVSYGAARCGRGGLVILLVAALARAAG